MDKREGRRKEGREGERKGGRERDNSLNRDRKKLVQLQIHSTYVHTISLKLIGTCYQYTHTYMHLM